MAAASSSSSLSKFYQIEKLQGSNYLPWSLRIKMILEKSGNWGIIDGSERDPAKQPVAPGAQAPTDAEKAAWKKKDLDARTEIILHLGDRQLQLVRTLETAQEMWDLLKTQYQQTNVVSRVLLHKTLNDIQMAAYPTTEAFLEAWQSADDNLLIAGLNLSEEVQVNILLAALPDTWQSFVSQHSNTPNLKLTTLLANIRQEDQIRHRGRPQPAPSTTSPNIPFAMLAGGSRSLSRFRPRQFNSRQSQLLLQPNSYTRSFSSRQSRQPFMQSSYTPRFRNNQGASTSTNITPICNFCHRRGHTERQCRTKRRQLRSSNSRMNANLAYGADDLTEDVTTMHLYAAIAASSSQADDWYLDTGATHHMTGTQSWLHDCHPVSSSFEVRLGDDFLYKAASKGSLHLRLPNGSTTIVPDIYYVPGLTTNLLSVNELTRHGTSVEFQHNYCVIKTPCTSGVPTHLICSKQGMLYPLGL
ncbi:hypothetical protein L7F22_053486 [Adiantum nelumboides]|nr:hypothetical protein [Adiantum nelumboides]